MIDVLMDGRAHAVGALARAAGVAASTATEHLSRLEDGGVVVVRPTGRQRLVQLAGPSVAAAYEALAELSREREANGLRGRTPRDSSAPPGRATTTPRGPARRGDRGRGAGGGRG